MLSDIYQLNFELMHVVVMYHPLSRKKQYCDDDDDDDDVYFRPILQILK